LAGIDLAEERLHRFRARYSWRVIFQFWHCVVSNRSFAREEKVNITAPDRKTFIAFFLVVLLGGSNSVAIRFSNMELPPFFGAAMRFVFASLIFWMMFFIGEKNLPNKRDTLVLLLNGFISVGMGFAFLYWGLQKIQANLATVILALGPLLTFFLAFLHRIESFRWRIFVGGLIAFVGMAIAVNAQLGRDIPFASLLALMAGATLSAEGNVILKIFAPKSEPVTLNALSLSSGAVFLLIASFGARETWLIPSHSSTWLALTYLVLGGSVLMFYFFVYVLTHWTVSATSYAILLFPIFATVFGALLAGEKVTPLFLAGSAIVIVGVWFGAFSRFST
jgi:drug/metabolite transporter (DMT)-like permease